MNPEPMDLYAGAPYHQRSAGGTSYVLYGVGENRNDDGGSIVAGMQETKQLDAAWPCAPPETPVKK